MLLPVLKPAGWAGLAAGVRAHVWIGTVDDPQVLVAYAEHGDERRDFVDATSEWGRSDEMVHHAFANLERHHTGFDLIETEGNRLLISVGEPLAAERALIESHMVMAQEKLGAEEVVVSLTRRGLLLVCARDGGRAVRRTMLGAHAEALDSVPSGELLCTDLVLMRDGRLIGTLEITEPWD